MPPFVAFILGGYMESKKRSLIKTVSWHSVHIVMVGLVAFIVTKRLDLAAIIASAELVWESVLYFAHERAWAKWGKHLH